MQERTLDRRAMFNDGGFDVSLQRGSFLACLFRLARELSLDVCEFGADLRGEDVVDDRLLL